MTQGNKIHLEPKYSTLRVFSMLLVTALMLVVTACSNDEEYAVTADRFVDAYYVRDSVADAIVYTAGSARKKLDGELPGSHAPTAADRPMVSIERLSSKREGKHMIFVYQITPPQVEQLTPRIATLTVESTDQGPRIVKITEAE